MKKKLTIMAIAILFASLICLGGLPTTANATTDKAISVSPYSMCGYERRIMAEAFASWGYDTWNAREITKSQFEAYVRNNACKFMYVGGHGTSQWFDLNDAEERVYGSEIKTWFENRDKATFVFLEQCGGMCYPDYETSLSHAYRKGSLVNTVTIGYCGMSWTCPCMQYRNAWKVKLLEHIETGVTWKEAFDYADSCYPECIGYTRFRGDETMTLTNCYDTLPDLRVEDFWADGSLIRYTIKNYGDADAGFSFTGLKVDGEYTDFWKTPPVSGGGTTGGAFGFYEWTCTGESDTIEVIADYPPGHVEENDESNNGMTKIFTCGGDAGKNCIGADLTPIEIFSQYDKIAFKVKNLGTLPSVTCYHAIYFYQNGHWTYQGRKKASAQEPGVIKTLRSYIYWPPQGTRIRVVVNVDQAFSDCNPGNDKMEVTV
jgi:hypothetical protein